MKTAVSRNCDGGIIDDAVTLSGNFLNGLYTVEDALVMYNEDNEIVYLSFTILIT